MFADKVWSLVKAGVAPPTTTLPAHMLIMLQLPNTLLKKKVEPICATAGSQGLMSVNCGVSFKSRCC